MFARRFSDVLTCSRNFSEIIGTTSASLTSQKDYLDDLNYVLKIVKDITLTSIKASPDSFPDSHKENVFEIELQGANPIKSIDLFHLLEDKGISVQEVEPLHSVWFPRTIDDLNGVKREILALDENSESNHPGFNDKDYIARRSEIGENCKDYKISDEKVPSVKYNSKETQTWTQIFDTLIPLQQKHACKEYNELAEDMRKNCGFERNNIPQLQDVNNYLGSKTGFKFIPVSGTLAPREFLTFLAFKMFPCTQYIRHHSVPFYTPEPDLIHEIIGHTPLLAHQESADFIQKVGLVSLGTDDLYMTRLFSCLWFSIEMGLLLEPDGTKKVYGAGVLSSVNEILHAMSSKPKLKQFDPIEACDLTYPFTTFQPLYCWVKSLQEAKELIFEFINKNSKGFTTFFDKKNQKIKVHRSI
jgi:phenylalanine-4-hydroxylase